MTAAEIIDGITRLPPGEQAGVVRFVYQLDAERNSAAQNSQRFVSAPGAAEASRVREEIVRGFYGGKIDG